MISINSVTFNYRKNSKSILNNINLEIKDKEIFGILGPSGAGKTTLIKLITGQLDSQNGEILVDGVNLYDINEKSMYEYVSAVFQDFIKYPLTVNENILVAYKKNVCKDELIKATEFSGAYDFIKNLPQGFSTKLQKEWKKGQELSVGQWQKIAIARGYMKNSSIIVLDEPTAAIDAVAESNMFDNFKNLKSNRMCILVTHRFSSIKLVEQILVIEDDDLVRQGIVDILELKGWNAVAAKSCSEALVRIRGEEYMLYVLDMKLPDGNGIMLCREIRRYTDNPILFLSAYDSEEFIVEGFEAGANDYVIKPFRTFEFIARIKALLRRTGMQNGKKVKKGLRVIVIPATQKIYLQAMEEGLLRTFIEAGAVVSTPTCGPCLGGYMGILAAGERCVSTTNRNFVGRMGHVDSEVYLASPAVAAASAITGKISSPEEVM